MQPVQLDRRQSSRRIYAGLPESTDGSEVPKVAPGYAMDAISFQPSYPVQGNIDHHAALAAHREEVLLYFRDTAC